MAESWQHRTMRDILQVLFTRWLSGLLILAAVVAAAVLVTVYLPKIYQSQVTLMSPLTQAEQALTGDIRADTVWEVVLKNQYEILMGDTVLSRALARVRNSGLSHPRTMDETVKALEDGRTPGDVVTRAAEAVSQQDIVEFRKQVRMEVPGGQTLGRSQVFTIFVRAEDDPAQAKLRANIVAQEFIYRYHELVLEMLFNRRKAADDGLKDLTARYEPVRVKYAEFLNGRGSLADVAQLISLMRGPISDVGSGRVRTSAQELATDVRSRIAYNEKLYAEIQAILDQADEARRGGKEIPVFPVPEEVRRDNPAVRKYTEQLADKVSARIQMESQYTRDYVPLIQVKAEIAQLQEQLLGVLRAGHRELGGLIGQLKAQEAALGASTQPDQVAAVPAGKVGEVITGMQKLDTEWSTLQQLWQKQLTEYNQARLAFESALSVQMIKATDKAEQPDKPIRPIVWLNVVIGVIVGLLLSLTYLFLADFYDHSVKSTDEVERYLGVPVLASVKKMGRLIRR